MSNIKCKPDYLLTPEKLRFQLDVEESNKSAILVKIYAKNFPVSSSWSSLSLALLLTIYSMKQYVVVLGYANRPIASKYNISLQTDNSYGNFGDKWISFNRYILKWGWELNRIIKIFNLACVDPLFPKTTLFLEGFL